MSEYKPYIANIDQTIANITIPFGNPLVLSYTSLYDSLLFFLQFLQAIIKYILLISFFKIF